MCGRDVNIEISETYQTGIFFSALVYNAKFANKMLIINAIPAHMYEAEACGTTPRAPMQFVQQERNSYSWDR